MGSYSTTNRRHGTASDGARVNGQLFPNPGYRRVADHSDRTTVLAGIRQHPWGARRDSGRCGLPSTRTLTPRFSLEYPWSPSPTSFCDRCIHEQLLVKLSSNTRLTKGVICPEKSIRSI